MGKIIKRADIDCLFKSLSDEDKKAAMKTLIWKNLVHDYIESSTEAYATDFRHGGVNIPSEDEVDIYRSKEVKYAATALDSMLDVMFGEDEELKYRLFQKFINEYCDIEAEVKKDICGNAHDFTDWEDAVSNFPDYDLDGDYVGIIKNQKCFKRTCRYCGEEQIVRTEEGKDYCDYYDNGPFKEDIYRIHFPKQRRKAHFPIKEQL